MDRNERANDGERGYCICLNCHTRVPLQSWITSLEMNCPKCGAIMVHEGSPYHLYSMAQGVAFDGASLVPSRRLKKRRRKNRALTAQGQQASCV